MYVCIYIYMYPENGNLNHIIIISSSTATQKCQTCWLLSYGIRYFKCIAIISNIVVLYS